MQRRWSWKRKTARKEDSQPASGRLLIVLVIAALVSAVGYFELVSISRKLGYVPRSIPGPQSYK